jgi:hypothetical protein
MTQTTRIPKARRPRSASLYLAAAMTGAVTLAGCASTPNPPTEALQAAATAITHAEQARVADYASPELGQARDQLAAARSAVAQEQMVAAQRLAEQSRASAELAAAKAEVVKARAVNDEMRKSTETLKQEMQRNTGVQQ